MAALCILGLAMGGLAAGRDVVVKDGKFVNSSTGDVVVLTGVNVVMKVRALSGPTTGRYPAVPIRHAAQSAQSGSTVGPRMG